MGLSRKAAATPKLSARPEISLGSMRVDLCPPQPVDQSLSDPAPAGGPLTGAMDYRDSSVKVSDVYET
jgi:hypothetical protein